MKDLCLSEVKAVSGGAAGEFAYSGNYLLEDLGDGLSRLTMLIVMEGDLGPIDPALFEVAV